MIVQDTLGDIRIGGLTFNTVDASGCAWIITDLDGWWNLPEADLPDDPRAYQYDGSYVTDGRYKARDITVNGVIVPPSTNVGLIATARQQLLSAMNAVRTSIAIEVDEPDASKTASCRLSGRPQISISNVNGTMQFQIPLRAPDPRKFSTSTSRVSAGIAVAAGGRAYPLTYNRVYPAGGSTGLLSVYNSGNYNGNAQIDITGPVTNPSIEHIEAGVTLLFNITLASSDTLTLDLDTHSVVLNGSASRRNTLAASSQWFSLLPGTNTLRFLGTTSGSPTITATYRSAWIG